VKGREGWEGKGMRGREGKEGKGREWNGRERKGSKLW
jgi:hypothetical protein